MDELGENNCWKSTFPNQVPFTRCLEEWKMRSLLTSEWEKKESGADRRVYTLTEKGTESPQRGAGNGEDDAEN